MGNETSLERIETVDLSDSEDVDLKGLLLYHSQIKVLKDILAIKMLKSVYKCTVSFPLQIRKVPTKKAFRKSLVAVHNYLLTHRSSRHSIDESALNGIYSNISKPVIGYFVNCYIKTCWKQKVERDEERRKYPSLLLQGRALFNAPDIPEGGTILSLTKKKIEKSHSKSICNSLYELLTSGDKSKTTIAVTKRQENKKLAESDGSAVKVENFKKLCSGGGQPSDSFGASSSKKRELHPQSFPKLLVSEVGVKIILAVPLNVVLPFLSFFPQDLS